MHESAYFLEAYLSKLGLPREQLGWLPFAHYLGTMLHFGVVAWLHRRGDVRRLCLWFTGLGRVVWLGIVAWPMIAMGMGLTGAAVHVGVLVFLSFSQILLLTGASLWASWTCGDCARTQSWVVLAWRQCASLLAMVLTLAILSHAWPDPGADGQGDLFYLTMIFAGAGLASLLSLGFSSRHLIYRQ